MADLHTAEFWANAPEYDTRGFWKLALAQRSETDDCGRDLLVIGVGAAGPIRCTREYGVNRMDLLRVRSRAARVPA